MVDAETSQAVYDPVEVRRILRRIRPRRAQDRAAEFVDSVNGIFIEIENMVDVALHQPLKALDASHDPRSTASCRDRCGPDDTINPWCGPATYYDSERCHEPLVPPG
jgi:hypothetical protein